MMTQRPIFAMHRLAHAGLSMRRIAAPLGINRQSVQKYRTNPAVKRLHFRRARKLDPCTDESNRLWEIAPQVSAGVMRQRLDALGFDGGITILRDYLRDIREVTKAKHPVLRCASAPGVQCQTDWGHFGSIT